MGNCISMQTERDARAEDVENSGCYDSFPPDDESENLYEPYSKEIGLSSTSTSSKNDSDEDVENYRCYDSLPSDDELENILEPYSIEIGPSSTSASSKNNSDETLVGSCDQRSKETVPDQKRLKIKSKCHPEPPSNTIQSNPSCLSNPSNQESDKNCKKSCGLQYGISDVFTQTVFEQQKVKASKSHIKPKTFDDPNDQKYYGHMLKDVMVKNFSTDDER